MLQKKPTCPDELAKYVRVGDVATRRLQMQAQYACRYLDGENPDEYPDVASEAFGTPLRVFGSVGNYDYMIHEDDVEAFVARVEQYRSTA